ncbi:MAG: hypothetical protein MUE97_07285, partial [Phycisphaerales bacterium]|nr:hypothetical protein [Phycisphaerales bacterium]
MSAFRPPSSDRNPWPSRGGGGGGGSGGGGRGGFWRRVIAPTDNPLDWALPMGSFRGIAVRVGLLYIAWMVFQIVPNLGGASGILAGQLWMLGSLFVLVLLHEFGHCFACRWVGGEADDILMWPLGGLASCRPPHTWKANFITTAGGPLVNVALLPVLGGVLLALGQGWNVLIFNPLTPFDAWRNLDPSAAPGFVSGWLLTML